MYCNIAATLSEHQEMQQNKNKHIPTNRLSRRAGNELTMLSILGCCFFERCASSRPLKSRSCRVHLDAPERVWLASDIVGMCLKQPLVLSDFFALIMYNWWATLWRDLAEDFYCSICMGCSTGQETLSNAWLWLDSLRALFQCLCCQHTPSPDFVSPTDMESERIACCARMRRCMPMNTKNEYLDRNAPSAKMRYPTPYCWFRWKRLLRANFANNSITVTPTKSICKDRKEAG
ncbi:hypothetical protein BKA59DRAFT_4062 [Fusarium tricinctum]|uniref:Uncharacterized protein n=1 Tax=Fusarium tricinctum TaxID=61284 RepID=A0A8K0SBZ8_9HYPO|nr:hypothetical protein BKA59DRAFT_4062 [Fusarium tricinctum]